MLSHNTNQPRAWHFKAFNHVLKKYGVTLKHDSKRMKQMYDIYNAINQFNPTALDHLEILRFFEKSLATRNHFNPKINQLDVVDLFYASALLGLKVNSDNDENPNLSLYNITIALPEDHRYWKAVKKSGELERMFIESLAWKIHARAHTSFEDYTSLLKPLDQETLAQFAATYLLLALNGAGDGAIVDDVLSTIYPNFRKKADTMMEAMQHLPLRYCFIDHGYIRGQLKQCFFNFLIKDESKFSLSKELLDAIKGEIQHYFLNNKRGISKNEISGLQFYLEKEIVKDVVTRNTGARLIALESSLEPISQINTRIIFNALFDQLHTGTLKPLWLAAALSKLESLNATESLSEGMFVMALTDTTHTLSILNAYADINREGWLVLIKKNPILYHFVARLVRNHHQSTNLTTMVHDELSTYLHSKPLIYDELSHLNITAVSTQGKRLASTLIMELMLKKIREMGRMFKVDPNTLEKLHDAITDYFIAHEREHLALLYAVMVLERTPSILTAPLYLNMLSKPEQLRFKARIALTLHRELTSHKLLILDLKAHTLLRPLYKAINKDTATLTALNTYFRTPFWQGDDQHYTLASIPLVSALVRTTIDQVIVMSKIELNDHGKNNLQKFYSDNAMPEPSDTKSPSLSPLYCMTLFSPAKNADKLATQNMGSSLRKKKRT